MTDALAACRSPAVWWHTMPAMPSVPTLSSPQVIVVGGGIIGLCGAWQLVRAGCRVTVLDGAPGAKEASWAAAGMLAPHHEAHQADGFWHLLCAGLDRWRALADDLGGTAAIDLRFAGGVIPVAPGDAEDAAMIERRAAWLVDAGIPVERLAGEALRRAVPGLSPSITCGVRLPAGQVNPRLVCERLAARLRSAGAELRYDTAVDHLLAGDSTRDGGHGVVLVDGTRLAADTVVLASGAWTPALARLAQLDLPGEPVKGQLLRFAGGEHLLRSFIHSRHAYLVPRRDLGVVVGATMVWTGFDKTEDPVAIARLATSARELLPALRDLPIAETWTGLRPRLLSGQPCIERIRPGLVVATGHFRNGILLAPATGERIRDLVLGR